jgi:hypothetical protein
MNVGHYLAGIGLPIPEYVSSAEYILDIVGDCRPDHKEVGDAQITRIRSCWSQQDPRQSINKEEISLIDFSSSYEKMKPQI